MTTCLGMPAMLQASESVQAASHSFDIGAGPLDQALVRFADQAGLRLVVASEVLDGRQSAGLQGRFSVPEGIARLLAGSELQASVNGDTLLIETRPAGNAPMELGATLIEGQGMGMMTENTGSYTTERVSIGSKSPTSLRRTPQSVSVVTSEVIEEQRITDLADALETTPGITVKNNNFRLSDFYARGFKIENIQIDGAAPMALGTTSGSFYSNKAYDLSLIHI